MKFVKITDLKPGMRLAKPIYNRTGVLLYDRNSRLTNPAINSIKNFGLIGIFILEPAEPLPPLTREDIEFEQCQTIYLFQLRELMDHISRRQPIDDVNRLVEDILKHYGTLDHRVNFNQNLRSSEDFMYKHAISMAILVAMITSRLGYTHQRQSVAVTAALLYDYGLRNVPKAILDKGEDLADGDREMVQLQLEKGLDQMLTYKETNDLLGRSVSLMMSYIYSSNPERSTFPDEDLVRTGWVLRVSDDFDRMTAMNLGKEPMSEIAAMQHLLADPNTYNASVVGALAESIHIVPSCANVDLSDGDKGIVLVENPSDFMHPVILRFSDHQIYDLSDPEVAKEIQVRDIMKTMDNRISVDEETLEQFVPDERLQKLAAKFKKQQEKVHKSKAV